MSDEKARKRERDNKAAMGTGDMTGASAVGRDQARAGGGLAGFFRSLIEKWVYVEGCRLNYRGILKEVYIGGDGEPTGCLLDPCIRVGEWGDQPQAQYEETMNGPHVLLKEGIIEMGLQMKAWPQKSQR